MNWLMPAGAATAASRIGRFLSGLFLSLCVSVPALGTEPAATQTVGDLSVSLVLVPSRMVDDGQHRKEVQKMHGGVPGWGNPYHVITSVFDAMSGQRLKDVDVRARVIWRDSKLTGAPKRLEPMIFEGRESWGNFFSVPAADPFRIRLDIRREPERPLVTIGFPYRQRPHFDLP